MKNALQGQALAVALCLPCAAFDQPAGVAPVSEAPLQYRSAFEGYKPYQDTKPGDWRSLNEAVKDEDSTAGMPGMGNMPGHTMPVSAVSASSPASRNRALGKTVPVPNMPAMPGMADHSGHHMSEGKP